MYWCQLLKNRLLLKIYFSFEIQINKSASVIHRSIIGIPKIFSCLEGVILHSDQRITVIYKSSSHTQLCSLFSSSGSYESENFLLLNMAKSNI